MTRLKAVGEFALGALMNMVVLAGVIIAGLSILALAMLPLLIGGWVYGFDGTLPSGPIALQIVWVFIIGGVVMEWSFRKENRDAKRRR